MEIKVKTYKCTVKFEKCARLPDFSTEVQAISEKLAMSGARDLARQCGYRGLVKQVTAREMSQSD